METTPVFSAASLPLPDAKIAEAKPTLLRGLGLMSAKVTTATIFALTIAHVFGGFGVSNRNSCGFKPSA